MKKAARSTRCPYITWLVLEGKSASDIARTFNVHAATIYRIAQM
jgi:transposase